MSTSSQSQLQIGGRSLTLSNLDKVLYPEVGFTKAQVIDYYARIAPVLIPHLSGRPLTLKRYPNGVDGMFFYEKNCPASRPPWVATAPVWSKENQREMKYCLVEDAATLLWIANLASLELHTSLSRAEAIERPTMVVFDLDPGAPANLIDCAQVALWLRELLAEQGLVGFPKTSGKKGMQLYVPLNTPTSYEQTKTFAHALAERLEKQHPDQVVSLMRKDLRQGKVFVDWSQNDRHKTTVCVYSLRAEPEPTVSTPITWKEVEAARKKRKPDALRFSASQVLARVAKQEDLFAPLLTMEQELPSPEAAPSRRPRTRGARTAKKTPGGGHLEAYVAKRDFTVTPEPPPEASAPAPHPYPTYMIHKHHASRLHYDLRLEMDGALASWAIPKGPSFDPSLKRLAVQTEDHPLEYGNFEGRIPEGQYGAGDSLIWDRGIYETLPPGQASQQRRKGHLDLVFQGKKLRGRFQLVRTGTDERGKAQWLFFKSKGDNLKDVPEDVVAERPESVVSGRRVTRGPEKARAVRKPMEPGRRRSRRSGD